MIYIFLPPLPPQPVFHLVDAYAMFSITSARSNGEEAWRGWQERAVDVLAVELLRIPDIIVDPALFGAGFVGRGGAGGVLFLG